MVAQRGGVRKLPASQPPEVTIFRGSKMMFERGLLTFRVRAQLSCILDSRDQTSSGLHYSPIAGLTAVAYYLGPAIRTGLLTERVTWTRNVSSHAFITGI